MVKTLNKIQKLTPEQQQRSNIVDAASGRVMADGLSQDPMLVQVRLRNGEMVYAKDLPKISNEKSERQPNGDYQVALVLDHTGKAEDQVGAAWLFVDNGILKALVVWTTNEKALNLKPVADDGFLQFSTEGWVSEIDDNGKYGDFWIDTLSPVTSGNDPGTQVLNQQDGRILIKNSIRFTNERETEMVKKENEITPEERQSIIDEVKAEIMAEIQDETVAENEVENDVETEEETTPEEEVEEIEEEKVEKEVTKNKISTTPKTPVANQAAKQPIVRVTNEAAQDAAVAEFDRVLNQAFRDGSGRGGVAAGMKAYKDRVQNAGITGSAILPDKIVSTFFKAWMDNEGSYSAFKFMNSRAGSVYAASSTDTALGHAKGEAKAEQTVDLVRRDLKAVGLYKKLIIDKQDLFDDESGNLVKFRAQELAARIQNQILVAALLGGTQEGSVGGTGGGGTRGLFGIVPDSAAGSGFGPKVATAIAGTSNEDAYSAVVKTIGSIAITAGGNVTSAGLTSTGITLFVPYAAGGASWITQLLLTKDLSGNYMFNGGNLEQMLRVKQIVEVPELAASNKIIAVADAAYQLYGENKPEMYPFFDTETNKDVLLAEQYIAGSLAGYKQAAVYTPFSS